MKAYRQVSRRFVAPEVMMGDIKIRQAIPTNSIEQISPFLLLHHFDKIIEPGDDRFYVAPHPHRGFCPITFLFEGGVEHRDSLGNEFTIESNEVQWITAGRGLIHSEKASKQFIETGGQYQGIQLWINLPAAQKLSSPQYMPITSNMMEPVINNGCELRLVSGTLNGKTGPGPSEVTTAMLRMEPDGFFEFEKPSRENTVIYILEGEIQLNDVTAAGNKMLVTFESTDGPIKILAKKTSKLLLLSGSPINEPLATYGPFVMNTQTEIMEAVRDYQNGKMGFLY